MSAKLKCTIISQKIDCTQNRIGANMEKERILRYFENKYEHVKVPQGGLSPALKVFFVDDGQEVFAKKLTVKSDQEAQEEYLYALSLYNQDIPTPKPIRVEKVETVWFMCYEKVVATKYPRFQTQFLFFTDNDDVAMQMDYGRYIGAVLKKMHSLPLPPNGTNLSKRLAKWIDSLLLKLQKHQVPDALVPYVDYLKSFDTTLLLDGDYCFLHTDFVSGNIMGEYIIDLPSKNSFYGSKYFDFMQLILGMHRYPSFANSVLNTYFDEPIPSKFWKSIYAYAAWALLNMHILGRPWLEDLMPDAVSFLEHTTNLSKPHAFYRMEDFSKKATYSRLNILFRLKTRLNKLSINKIVENFSRSCKIRLQSYIELRIVAIVDEKMRDIHIKDSASPYARSFLSDPNNRFFYEINGGNNPQRKYVLAEADGNTSFVKIYTDKGENILRRYFFVLNRLFQNQIPMAKPSSVIAYKNEVVLKYKYIQGHSLNKELAKVSKEQQYTLGLEAGRILLSIHCANLGFSVTQEEATTVMARLTERAKLLGSRLLDEGMELENKEHFVSVLCNTKIEVNPQFLGIRHGDFHGENILCSGGKLFVIDFSLDDNTGLTSDYVLKDFRNIQKMPIPFRLGILHSYFPKGVPLEFWEFYQWYILIEYIRFFLTKPKSRASYSTRLRELAYTGVPDWYVDNEKFSQSRKP